MKNDPNLLRQGVEENVQEPNDQKKLCLLLFGALIVIGCFVAYFVLHKKK